MTIIKILITVSLIVMGLIFRRGKALFLIAGNNTATKPYDKRSLLVGKYTGIILYGTALIVALIFFVPEMPKTLFWLLIVVFTVFTLTMTISVNRRVRKMSK